MLMAANLGINLGSKVIWDIVEGTPLTNIQCTNLVNCALLAVKKALQFAINLAVRQAAKDP